MADWLQWLLCQELQPPIEVKSVRLSVNFKDLFCNYNKGDCQCSSILSTLNNLFKPLNLKSTIYIFTSEKNSWVFVFLDPIMCNEMVIFCVLKLIFIKLNDKQNNKNILIMLQVKLLVFLILWRVPGRGEVRGVEHGEVCEPAWQVWLERNLRARAQGRPRLPRISRRQWIRPRAGFYFGSFWQCLHLILVWDLSFKVFPR